MSPPGISASMGASTTFGGCGGGAVGNFTVF